MMGASSKERVVASAKNSTEPYREEIQEVLNELRIELIDMLNAMENANPDKFVEKMEKWLALRQRINNEQNIGVLIAPKLDIKVFPLTGDFKRDLGQIRQDVAKNLEQMLTHLAPKNKKPD